MRRFLTDMQIQDLRLPEGLTSSRDELEFLLPSSAVGTLGEVGSLHSIQYLQVSSALKLCPSSNFPAEVWTFTDIYQLGGVDSVF